MCRSYSLIRSLLLALFLLLVAQTASASRFFGVGPNCAYPNIQAAITALLNFSKTLDPCGFDHEIFLVGGTTYTEPLTIDSSGISWPDNFAPCQGAVVQITGGFDATCDNPDPNNPISTISATATHSVLNIRGNAAVFLNNLFLTNGSPALDGGGINFNDNSTSGVPASGYLDLTNVTIANNKAGFGGGIFARGHPPGIVIALHHDTFVKLNTATQSGGGIDIEGVTYLNALEDNILIEHNTASGSGGGLRVISGATADIASPGSSTFNQPSVINSNNATNGGGIIVEDSRLRVFSTISGLPTRIDYNTATNGGGGVYLDNAGGSASFCGDSYGIDHNTALNGAAIYASSSLVDLKAADLQCSSSNALPAFAACPVGMVCNTIDGNIATLGDVISLVQTDFVAERIELSANSTRSLLAENSGSAFLTNCLITGNSAAQTLVSAVSAAYLSVDFCTVGANSFGNAAFYTTGDFSLHASIIWQPEMTTLDPSSTLFRVSADSLIVTDDDSFYGLSFLESLNVSDRDPAFVDSGIGDFHLLPESFAVDNSFTGPATDIEGRPRPVNLLHLNGLGFYDVGAYEQQDKGDMIFSDGVDRIIFN